MNNKEIRLKNFIEENHHIVKEYQLLNYNYTTSLAKSRYDIICILFMNSLEAAGGKVKLDNKYKCYEHFKKMTGSLASNGSNDFLDFEEFLKLFYKCYSEPKDIKKVVERLVADKDLPQIAHKKANLFVKELVLHAGGKVFNNFKEVDYISYLEVPIDVVISDLRTLRDTN